MKYVIAGYGKFGRIALERLLKSFQAPEIVIVELGEHKRPDSLPSQVRWTGQDVVGFLKRSSEVDLQDIIIPMVPFHLAAAYILSRDSSISVIPLPSTVAARVPNPYPMDASTLCCSRADFLCPDDCPEGDRCTVTGEQRHALYSDLENLIVPGFTVCVQRSSQILPGVGGYTVGQLSGMAAGMVTGKHLIATSCKCHGILTALEKA